MLMPIGELARQADVPVKTLRYWSDIGIVPPARRTDAGYRMYGDRERLRLEVVKALRDVGFGVEEISGMVLDHEDLRGALRMHLRAVRSRQRALRRLGVVLQAALDRDEAPVAHLARLEVLARVSAEEHDATLDEPVDADAAVPRWEPTLPDLPEQPTPAQRDAWLELAALLADPTAVAHDGGDDGDGQGPDVTGLLHDVMEARGAGVAPDDPRADLLVERLLDAYADALGAGDDLPRRLLDHVTGTDDLRSRRYWKLVARVRGWPDQSPQALAMDWLVTALQLRCG